MDSSIDAMAARDDEDLKKEEPIEFDEGSAHTLVVNMFDDIEKFTKVPDEWSRPEIKPYTPGENLHLWLVDPNAREQFVIRAGTDTEVYWYDARLPKPEPYFKRSFSVLDGEFVSMVSFGYFTWPQCAALWGDE